MPQTGCSKLPPFCKPQNSPNSESLTGTHGGPLYRHYDGAHHPCRVSRPGIHTPTSHHLPPPPSDASTSLPRRRRPLPSSKRPKRTAQAAILRQGVEPCSIAIFRVFRIEDGEALGLRGDYTSRYTSEDDACGDLRHVARDPRPQFDDLMGWAGMEEAGGGRRT